MELLFISLKAQIEKLSVFYRTEFHTTTLNIIIDNLEIYHERFALSRLVISVFIAYGMAYNLCCIFELD